VDAFAIHMMRREFLLAQAWAEPLGEAREWPCGADEIFRGTCVMSLADSRLHFRSPLLGSSTETPIRLGLARPAAAVGAKRARHEASRLLACFEAEDAPLLCRVLHSQITRLVDNAARDAAAGGGDGGGGAGSGAAGAAGPSATPPAPPFMELHFGSLVLRLAPSEDVPESLGAAALCAARDAMLRDLPRAAAAPSGPADAVPADCPAGSLAAAPVAARVAHWQVFMRCAQQLSAERYPRQRLLSAMAASLGEAYGAGGAEAARARHAAASCVRLRETDYVQQAARSLKEASPAAEEVRQQARSGLKRAYRALLASLLLPARGEGGGYQPAAPVPAGDGREAEQSQRARRTG